MSTKNNDKDITFQKNYNSKGLDQKSNDDGKGLDKESSFQNNNTGKGLDQDMTMKCIK